MTVVLQYDARDAVLNGMRRDYNLADYPVQANDFSVSPVIQPVVDIKDSVTIRCYLGKQLAGSTTFTLSDPRTGKNYQGWFIRIKRIVATAATGIYVKGYRDRIYFNQYVPLYIGGGVRYTEEIDLPYDTVNCKQMLTPTINDNSICFESTDSASYISFDVEMTPGKPQLLPMQESA